MPIHLNLLAETQAEEELRRRDPVKRAIWAGGFFVSLVLLYYLLLVGLTLVKYSTLKNIEQQQESRKAEYQKITNNEKNLEATKHTLAELNRLASNRLLWGNVLNALQASVVDDVQCTSFRSEQTHTLNDGGKTKPSTVTEKLVLIIDARDSSPTPGDQINKYKAALNSQSFLGKTPTNQSTVTIKLKNLSSPVLDSESGKQAVNFSFECQFADKVIK